MPVALEGCNAVLDTRWNRRPANEMTATGTARRRGPARTKKTAAHDRKRGPQSGGVAAEARAAKTSPRRIIGRAAARVLEDALV